MGQITVQKLKRRKVTAALPDPEIIIDGYQDDNNVKFSVKLDFKDSLKYLSHDSKILLYPMTTQGVVLLPLNLGTVEKIELNEKGYELKDQLRDNLYFNLKISKPDSRVEGFAYRLKFKKIEEKEDEIETDDEGESQSILPIVEVPDQSVPYKINMQPVTGQPPTLYVRTGMKNKIKSSAVTQYLITTSAIKEIITNYIIDKESEGDTFREKWEILIKNLMGDNNFKFPSREEALERSGAISEDVVDLIDDVIIQFGRKRMFRGTQYSLNDAFINELSFNEDKDDENESM